MTIATNPGPFAGDSLPNENNRIRRITFLVGPSKTVAHVDHRGSGSKAGYEKARDDSSDPANIQVTERNTYITEES